MFSPPYAGWTTWKINGHKIGPVSYIDDVPYIFIDACVRYIHDPGAFNVSFDAEGYNTGIVQIGDRFISYSTTGDEPTCYLSNMTFLSDFLFDESEIEFVKGMLREAIEDFERDFELWSEWNPGLYEDEEEIEAAKTALSSLIEKGKAALEYKIHQPELGNLLFGNSRGEFPIDRDEIEDLWYEAFDCIVDGYGYVEDSYKYGETERGGFENDTFLINPYYWGEDEEIAAESNFVYKPENITIDWYKYPMRDSYSNVELSKEKAKEIFEKCIESVNEHD